MLPAGAGGASVKPPLGGLRLTLAVLGLQLVLPAVPLLLPLLLLQVCLDPSTCMYATARQVCDVGNRQLRCWVTHPCESCWAVGLIVSGQYDRTYRSRAALITANFLTPAHCMDVKRASTPADIAGLPGCAWLPA